MDKQLFSPAIISPLEPIVRPNLQRTPLQKLRSETIFLKLFKSQEFGGHRRFVARKHVMWKNYGLEIWDYPKRLSL
jgi:hypothetical protein